MNPDRFTATLADLIKNQLADVHTAVPAKLTSVDYGSGRASALPLVKTQIGVNKAVAYPELGNIPLVIMSGNGGKARMTFPVQAGDTVIVLFSERDPTNFLAGTGTEAVNPVQKNYLGLFPIGIIPCISSAGGAKAISNEDVLIENDVAKITLKPNGDMLFANEQSNISVTSSTISMTNGAGTISIDADGTVTINGLKISPSGKLTDGGGLKLDTHAHTGVESGSSKSGGPVN